MVTAGTGQVLVTGNAGKEVVNAAERVVQWAAANPAEVSPNRLGDGMALLDNVDCHFSFETVHCNRHGYQYGLSMAVALYCALTGATVRGRTAFVAGWGQQGALAVAEGASKRDAKAYWDVHHMYDTIVMEKSSAEMLKTAIKKHGPAARGWAAQIVGVKTFKAAITAGVDEPDEEQSRLVVVPARAPGP
jgi:hypothetical protein